MSFAETKPTQIISCIRPNSSYLRIEMFSNDAFKMFFRAIDVRDGKTYDTNTIVYDVDATDKLYDSRFQAIEAKKNGSIMVGLGFDTSAMSFETYNGFILFTTKIFYNGKLFFEHRDAGYITGSYTNCIIHSEETDPFNMKNYLNF